MQRLREFVEEWAFIIWLTAAMIGMGWIAFHPYPAIYAAPAAKQQEAGCTQFAKAGMWDIYHCIDENGNEFIANSAGMLISVGN